MFDQNAKAISDLMDDYFNGIYYGDIEKMRSVFHPSALLFADLNGQPYFKTLDEYLDVVRQRKSPHETGEAFRMKTLSVEVLNDVAYARLHVPVLGYNYHDFIALNKVGGKWLIVNKLFTHVAND